VPPLRARIIRQSSQRGSIGGPRWAVKRCKRHQGMVDLGERFGVIVRIGALSDLLNAS